MKVRFARRLAFSVMGGGAALLVLGVVLWIGGSPEGGGPVLASGLVGALIGVAYLGWLPYFVITDNEVLVPIMRGGAARTGLGPRDRLRLLDGRLVVVRSTGRRDPVPVRQWGAHPEDWRAMVAELTRRDTERY